MNEKPTPSAIALCLALLCSACSTLNSTDNITRGSPEYFIGTRLNLAAIRHDDETLYKFAEYSMVPAEHPVLDLPLSFVMDSAYAAGSLWYGAAPR